MRLLLTSLQFPLSKNLWQVEIPFKHKKMGSVHVDIGAGYSPRNPFGASRLISCDFASMEIKPSDGAMPNDFVACDLTRELPFEPNSIDSFSAYDVLEHIPRWERLEDGTVTFPFVNLMNEIHRCLKPGGIFLALTPAFPSPAAFQDPTHINIISDATHIYFVGKDPWAKLVGYGFNGRFDEVFVGWLFGFGPIKTLTSHNVKTSNLYRLTNIFIHFAKAVKRRHPTHILWVLQRPKENIS